MNHFRDTISKGEAISQIEQVYHAGYDPDSDLSVWEQLEICESIAETESATEKQSYNYIIEEKPYSSENVYVNGNVNDTYKRRVNFELTDNKFEVITKLKSCNYKTSPIIVASLLEEFFANPDTKPGYWLSVAQTWPPKRIYLTIDNMLKRQSGGWITIQNPAGYFTELIKLRSKRKSLLI